jgi:hypothetical protein
MVFAANGVNCLGYYMYHGGNNPHSVSGDDSPETTSQESSFQPAGSANPMNSESYDFFAPLGEFGQPRPHYHMMRRFHLFLRDFGADFARTVYAPAEVQPQSNRDIKSLRWGCRHASWDGNASSGFLFVNNHQRLQHLPPKTNARFQLNLKTASGGTSTILVPSADSSAVTVGSGSWFVWPFNLRSPGVNIAYATTQLICRVDNVLLFAATEGIPVELAIETGVQVTLHDKGATMTKEGGLLVVRGITPSTGCAATITITSTSTNSVSKVSSVRLVVLPTAMQDRVWKGYFGGKDRVFLTGEGMELVLTEKDGSAIHLRANTSNPSTDGGDMIANVSMIPYTPLGLQSIHQSSPASASPDTHSSPAALPAASDGVFSKISVPFAAPPTPQVEWKLVKPAASPARVVRVSGKAVEPTKAEWTEYAGVYDVTVSAPVSAFPSSASASTYFDTRLAIRYRGDSARLSFGQRLLTDNWFTGYVGHGQMEVGLTYLAGENPGLLAYTGTTDAGLGPGTTNLTLQLMPLKKVDLDTKIYMQDGHWPDFSGNTTVLALDAIDVLRFSGTTLVAAAA